MQVTYKHLPSAIGVALLASLSNALMAACIKWEITQGVSASMIVFWRSMWGLFFLLPMIHFFTPTTSIWDKIKTEHLGMHLIRSGTGFAGVIIFCLVLKHLTLTVATLLFFTVPLFIPFVGYIWKKRPLPRLGWIGLIIGFIGVVFVIQPGYEAFQPAVIFGLLSGLFTSIGQFSTHLLTATEKAQKINFYYFVICGVLGGILTLFDPVNNWGHLKLENFLFFTLIGFLGVCYLQLLTYALKHGPPPVITSLLYTVVLYSFLFDWLIWKQVPDWETLVGVFLVVLGVILKLILHHVDIIRLKKNQHK